MGLLEIFSKNLDLEHLDVKAIAAYKGKKNQEETPKKPRYLDLHCDTLTAMKQGNLFQNPGDIDLERALAMSRNYVQFFAIFQDAKYYEDREAEFDRAYARARQLLKQAEPYISLCTTGEELQQAMEEGKAAAILSVEDIAQMGTKVDQCRDLGITSAMLTWNYENEYAYGAKADQKAGLKPEGISLARRLLEQGVILDVSHLSDGGVDDLLHLTEAPIIASHSNVREVRKHHRNLSREHLRELIARGGLIGMNLYRPFIWKEGRHEVDLSDLRRHMDFVLDEGGEDCLCMGGDLDGCHGDFPAGFHGIQDIPAIVEELAGAGYEDSLIDKIFFKNGYDFLVRNLGVKHED